MLFTGGNQRDLARSKCAKKQADLERSKSAAEKDGNKGLSLEARKQRFVVLSACPLSNMTKLTLSFCIVEMLT